MSEEFSPFSRLGEYLLHLYRGEVTFLTEDPVGVRFLGVVSNNHKGLRYLFYVFEIALTEAVQLEFKVDQEDRGYWVDHSDWETLFCQIENNKADVITLKELLHLTLPGTIESGAARAIFRGYPCTVVTSPESPYQNLDAQAVAIAGIDQWRIARPAVNIRAT